MQTSEADAQKLAKALPAAKLAILEGMNYVLADVRSELGAFQFLQRSVAAARSEADRGGGGVCEPPVTIKQFSLPKK